MNRYLRHTPTGDLYIHTDILAKRDDMVLVDEPEPVVPEVKSTRKAKKEVVVEPAPAPASDLDALFGES